MGMGTECGAREKRHGRTQSKGGGAGSGSPARVPCVQRQKMVSERPGLLLVPHTSSTSSLVCSDMMGYRRTGLGFQDSRPGTWGRVGSETGVAGRQSQSRWKLRREAGERRKTCMQGLRLSSPLQRQLSFPYRKYQTTHFRFLSRYHPHHTQEPGSHLPGSGSGKRCGPLWKPLVILSSVPGPKCF